MVHCTLDTTIFFLVSTFLFCSTYFCSGFLGFSPTGRDFLLISGAVAVQDQRAKSFDMALLSPVDLYKKKIRSRLAQFVASAKESKTFKNIILRIFY